MESMVVNLRQLNAPKVGKLQIELECKFIYAFNASIFSISVEVLVGITLLLMWSTNLPPIQPRFHLLDLFAGQAAVTKVWPLVLITPFL